MNTRFSTYASYWIKQSMQRALVTTARTIRLPTYTVELLAKWRRATTALQEKLDRTPTEEEIAQNLSLTKRKLGIIKKALRIHQTNPQPDPSESSQSLDERVMDERARTPDEVMGKAEELNQIMEYLDTMDRRAATVLRMRFGLDGAEPKTLQEIGDRLFLTRERVRQIERETLSTMRKGLLSIDEGALQPGRRRLGTGERQQCVGGLETMN